MQKIGLEAILDLSNFNRGMGQYNQGIDDMTGKTRGLSGILGSAGKAIAGIGVIAGGIAMAGIAVLGKGIADVVGEAAESEAAIAALDAVIKSTGRDMTKTRKMTDKYSASLQKTTRFSDEQVMAAETMLLQFETMNEETFPTAIQLTADIATRLGTDMPSAATLLGKALAEPGEGLNRLRQAGITFTDAEEKAIKAMYEAGDAAGAQAAIMDKLQSSVGGAAVAAGDTYAGTMDRLKNSFSDIKEAIGGPILASLQTLADKLVTALGSPEVQATLRRITTWLENELPTAITNAINFLTNAYNGVKGILVDLGIVEPEIKAAPGENVKGPAGQQVDQAIGQQATPDAGKALGQAFIRAVKAGAIDEINAANKELTDAINTWLYETIEVPIRALLDKAPLWSDLMTELKKVPIFEWLTEVGNAIDRVITKIEEFIQKLLGLPTDRKLPDWVVGKSPPPLADWLTEISKAGARATGALASMGGSVQGMPAMTMPRTAAGASYRSVNVGGDTIIQNIADPASYVLALAIANDKRRERFSAAMGV